MRIVIDIPEEIYKTVQDGTYCGTLYKEIKSGVILPKGHGRLIDADKLESVDFSECMDSMEIMSVIDSQPTILESEE